MWNTSQHWRKGLFPEVQRSSISWMCKKQNSDSHSSTEAEVISLDAGLRMDGIHALDLWNEWLKYFIIHQTKPKSSKMLRESSPSSSFF